MSKNTVSRNIVLASSSVFRKKLLQQLRINFEVITPNIDESPGLGEPPESLVQRLSIDKAKAVVTRFPNHLIIGSDQVAVHDSKPVGKPENYDDAVNQLTWSSGKRIALYTGVSLLNSESGIVQTEVVLYEVRFRNLTRKNIENYLKKEQPYGCCGSIRADGLGIALLDELIGPDPTALIGLPLTTLVTMLSNEGVHVI